MITATIFLNTNMAFWTLQHKRHIQLVSSGHTIFLNVINYYLYYSFQPQ